MDLQSLPTPITDALEREIADKRDVPQRVYHQMHALERERAFMLETLRKVVEWGHDNGKTFTLKVASDSGIAEAVREAVALGKQQ